LDVDEDVAEVDIMNNKFLFAAILAASLNLTAQATPINVRAVI
jgi:hypothetical protein